MSGDWPKVVAAHGKNWLRVPRREFGGQFADVHVETGAVSHWGQQTLRGSLSYELALASDRSWAANQEEVLRHIRETYGLAAFRPREAEGGQPTHVFETTGGTPPPQAPDPRSPWRGEGWGLL